MPNRKYLNWESNVAANAETANVTDAVDRATPAANDSDGWEQYRRWVTKAPAPAPRVRRAAVDPALYTWRGYRSWTEQVRRNWTQDPTDDSE